MYRTYFLALGMLVLIALGAAASTYVVRDSQRGDGQSTKGTFSSSQTDYQFGNLFASDVTPAATTGTSNHNTVEEVTLDEILRNWEARSESGLVSYSEPSKQVPQLSDISSEQKGIHDIFADLLGPRLTDSLKGSGDTSFTNDIAIWTGTYTTSSPVVIVDEQSEVQRELHTYGNELGALLTAFTTTQGDQVALLDAFLKNRTETAALRALTNAYTELSDEIASIEPPQVAQSTHTRLSDAYAEVGTLLWNLTTAQDDSELVAQILTYNKASEAVAKQHIALVNLFSAYDVTFDPGEAGSVFVFPAQNMGTR